MSADKQLVVVLGCEAADSGKLGGKLLEGTRVRVDVVLEFGALLHQAVGVALAEHDFVGGCRR